MRYSLEEQNILSLSDALNYPILCEDLEWSERYSNIFIDVCTSTEPEMSMDREQHEPHTDSDTTDS